MGKLPSIRGSLPQVCSTVSVLIIVPLACKTAAYWIEGTFMEQGVR